MPRNIQSINEICIQTLNEVYPGEISPVVIRYIPNESNTDSLRPSYGHRNVGPGLVKNDPG